MQFPAPGTQVWVQYNSRLLEGVVVKDGPYPYEIVVEVHGERLVVHRASVRPISES